MCIDGELKMVDKESNCFPDSYPKDLLDCIIKDGAGQNTYEDVYRISDTGLCHRDAFICSALQNEVYAVNNRDSYLAQRECECDIDDWSTSCWQTLSKAKRVYNLKEKKGHSPAILKGSILPKTGYSIVTNERYSVRDNPFSRRKGHVDWWIFKDVDASENFSIMEEI